MDNNEKRHVSGILLFAAVLLSLCIVFVGAIALGTIPRTFYWGLPFGFIFGFLSWAYLNATWDPINMRPKKSKATILQGRWIPLIVILGIGSIRIMPYIIGKDNTYLLGECMGSWLFLTITYMMFQLWRYRQ